MRGWRAALALPLAALGLVLAPAGASAYQTPVESVDNGVIMDVSPSKILYRDPDFTPGGTLHIKDRATGAVEDVPPVPNRYPSKAFLSPHGVIFAGGDRLPQRRRVRVAGWNDDRPRPDQFLRQLSGSRATTPSGANWVGPVRS